MNAFFADYKKEYVLLVRDILFQSSAVFMIS